MLVPQQGMQRSRMVLLRMHASTERSTRCSRSHVDDIAAIAAAAEIIKCAAVEHCLPRQHRVHAITCNGNAT